MDYKCNSTYVILNVALEYKSIIDGYIAHVHNVSSFGFSLTDQIDDAKC